VGHWEGDTLVVETNNLRGAEDSPFDGWLDVNGSPYSQQAKFIERFKRLNFGHLIIDTTLEDAKAYTKPWTVRVDQRIMADEEPIEFVCNENQQFRRGSRSTVGATTNGAPYERHGAQPRGAAWRGAVQNCGRPNDRTRDLEPRAAAAGFFGDRGCLDS
jgi:hypothetical protein